MKSVYVCLNLVKMSVHWQVKMALPGVNEERHNVKEKKLEPYLGFDLSSKNYLHISVGSNKVAVGNSLIIRVYIKTDPPEHRKLVRQLTYAVSVGHFGEI